MTDLLISERIYAQESSGRIQPMVIAFTITSVTIASKTYSTPNLAGVRPSNTVTSSTIQEPVVTCLSLKSIAQPRRAPREAGGVQGEPRRFLVVWMSGRRNVCCRRGSNLPIYPHCTLHLRPSL
jgi:hypothetical protein